MASNPAGVRAAVAQLVGVPDIAFARDLCRHKEMPEVEGLHQAAQVAAADHWHALVGSGPSSHSLSPAEEIERCHVSVEAELPGPLDGAFVHFAVFDPGRKVVEVSTAAVAAVETCITQFGLADLLGDVSVMTVVLWHEYYHVCMREQAKQLQPSGRLRMPQVFRRAGSTSGEQQFVEEFGAILFSGLACGLSFNPQVLQWLLLDAKQPDSAQTMLDNILEMSVIK